MTRYTDKELRREAACAVREHGMKVGQYAKTLGYEVWLGDKIAPTLVAHGQLSTSREIFTVNAAI